MITNLKLCPLVILASSLLFVASYANQCSKHEEVFDKRLKKLFWVGEQQAQIPRSEIELDAFCEETRILIRDGNRFRSCLAPFPKLVVNIVNRQVRKFGKRFCNERKRVVLQRLQCLDSKNVAVFYECTRRAFVQLNYITANVTADEILPHFCCLFLSALQCSIDGAEKIQRDQRNAFYTGDSNTTHCDGHLSGAVQQMMGGLSQEAIELACGKLNTLDACRTQFNVGLKKLEQVAATSKTPLVRVPMITPLLKLAERLASHD